jgi:hypothetical protein
MTAEFATYDTASVGHNFPSLYYHYRRESECDVPVSRFYTCQESQQHQHLDSYDSVGVGGHLLAVGLELTVLAELKVRILGPGGSHCFEHIWKQIWWKDGRLVRPLTLVSDPEVKNVSNPGQFAIADVVVFQLLARLGVCVVTDHISTKDVRHCLQIIREGSGVKFFLLEVGTGLALLVSNPLEVFVEMIVLHGLHTRRTMAEAIEALILQPIFLQISQLLLEGSFRSLRLSLGERLPYAEIDDGQLGTLSIESHGGGDGEGNDLVVIVLIVVVVSSE